MQDDTTHTQAAAHGQLLLTLGWILLIRLPLTHTVQSDSTLGHVSIPPAGLTLETTPQKELTGCPFSRAADLRAGPAKGPWDLMARRAGPP